MWKPDLAETFVYRCRVAPKETALVIIPGKTKPAAVIIDGVTYVYDEEKTEQARMHIRVALRKADEDSKVAIEDESG